MPYLSSKARNALIHGLGNIDCGDEIFNAITLAGMAQFPSGEVVMPAKFAITAPYETWQDTGFSINLPEPGIYCVDANVRGQVQFTDAKMLAIAIKLVWGGVDVPNSTRALVIWDTTGKAIMADANFQAAAGYSFILECPSAGDVSLYAKKVGTSAAITYCNIMSDFDNGYTTLNYIRIH